MALRATWRLFRRAAPYPAQTRREIRCARTHRVEIDVGFVELRLQGSEAREANKKAASARHHSDRTAGRRSTGHVS